MDKETYSSELYYKNIHNFEWAYYMLSTVMIWPVMTLFYKSRGLTFFEIASLQSIGSIITLILEIPLGYLADRLGNRTLLILSGVTRIIGVVFLIVSNDFSLFIISEFFFAVSESSQSGSDTSFLYRNLVRINRVDDYRVIMSKLRGQQSLIRIITRFLSPLLFSLWDLSIFILAIISYCVVLLFYFLFKETPAISEEATNDAINNSASKTKTPWLSRLRFIISKYKRFLLLSMLSLLIFTLVSNYSQYIGPMLEQLHFDIAYLGIVLALGSGFNYLGTKISARIKSDASTTFLFTLAIIIALALVLFGFGDNVIVGIFSYFLICLCHSPFTILLGEKINLCISDKYRATALSVSNQIDNIGSILIDPIIGFYIDQAGFSTSYFYIGFIALFLLLISWIGIVYVKRNYKNA